MSENEFTLIRDYPDADCTDAAHPAWWRGHEAGTLSMISWINEKLDHPGRDESHGFFSHPIMRPFLDRLVKLRDNQTIEESPMAWHDRDYGEKGPY
jgi:hypothetical protein